METMKVKAIMSATPAMVRPMQDVQEAASIMKENGCGILPVGTPEQVVGVITDRDIVMRVVAVGKDATITPVQEAMTHKFISCEESDTIDHAAELMRKHDVSRVLVSHAGTVTGIVTIADLLRNKDDRNTSDKVLHMLLGHKTPH